MKILILNQYTQREMMNPNDFGDPVTLPLAPPYGQRFNLSSEIFQHPLRRLAP